MILVRIHEQRRSVIVKIASADEDDTMDTGRPLLKNTSDAPVTDYAKLKEIHGHGVLRAGLSRLSKGVLCTAKKKRKAFFWRYTTPPS